VTPAPARRRAVDPPAPSGDWAYFFDIDGTLVETAARPGAVQVHDDLVALLDRLRAETAGAVALISGRSIEDIDRLFPGAGFPAAGQHGCERRDAEGTVQRHPPDERLHAIRDRLAIASARHDGLLLEDKGASLALHYREAPRLAGYAHRAVRAAHAALGGQYALLAGKRVVELAPSGRDKGWAVLEFMQEAPFMGRRPVFVGDDQTDEFGFGAVNDLRGVSIKVGAGPTVARWRLAGVRAVRNWLETRR
jgi:trehalose 6-phosphate phosphatase